MLLKTPTIVLGYSIATAFELIEKAYSNTDARNTTMRGCQKTGLSLQFLYIGTYKNDLKM